jgi:hypothetical protein
MVVLLKGLGAFHTLGGPGIPASDALPEALVPLRGKGPGPAEIERQ